VRPRGARNETANSRRLAAGLLDSCIIIIIIIIIIITGIFKVA